MSAKAYNGHHCWNCWNVALWIGNDEGLYTWALDCVRSTRNRADAVERFHSLIGEDRATPDGARYTRTAVRSALGGL